MKELSIEEKAKAYDEAIEKFDVILNLNTVKESGKIFADDVRKIFPELKESEDERIRKSIIAIINNYVDNSNTFKPKMIAWLEKQGKTFTKKDVDDTYLKGVCDAKQELEKQGKQKPVVIIPNFRVGDNIKTTNEEPLTITKIDEKGYWSEDLFICGFNDSAKWELVEQKPADVRTTGYWHVQNVEQKPAWSEEDDIMAHDIDYALRCQITYPISRLQSMSTWINNLKNRVQPKQEWSEEDERIYQSIIDDTVQENQLNDKQTNWLRDIKYRYFPQQKQEWSKGDKVMLGEIIDFFENGTVKLQHDLSLYASWLKSLRPRNKWKPSDEQMEVLWKYAEQNNYDGMLLTSLYNDLKKLTE